MLEVRGGSDKGPDGHRRDTIPICNSLIAINVAAEPVYYSDQDWSSVYAKLTESDAVIVRVNPGKYDGVTQGELERLVRGAANRGVLAMSHPEVMKRMGAKDALVKIRDLSCSRPDTYAYYDIATFKQSFPTTIAQGMYISRCSRRFPDG